jgi:ParB/RepB/Spo0J family partition protein
LNTLPISSIQIPENRQRQEFDLAELNELGESIKTFGLFHPIILREQFEEVSSNPDIGVRHLYLVAGERRLRAVADIYELGGSFIHDKQPVPVGHIPYILLGELDELGREEAELEENIRRKDLSWQELATATARLSHLRTRQAAAAGVPAPTTAAIAKEVRGSSEGIHQATTRREILVAKHLDDPEIRAAKGVDDAFKILKRKEDAAKRVQLAAEIGRSYTAGSAHKALNEDSLGWMASVEEGQFDVILTDPPYGIDADTFGDSGGKAAGAHFYKDDYETWKEIITCLAKEGFRITKPQAHLYCFCDITRFEEAKAIFAQAGWKCFRTPIIWHKPNGSRTPWVDQGPQRKYEIILYANKGSRPVTRIYPDLVSYPADENLGHQAQKPVSLFTDLLRRSVGPGDQVLDPFAGSGPVLPAGHEFKCQVTAIEKDPAAYAICVGRVKALDAQPDLVGLI